MKTISKLQRALFTAALYLSVSHISSAESLTVKSPQGVNAVIELYTSEGCSSCPPADQWISHYAPASSASEGVVALAFHVDYWNYLGWEDAYSKPEFTARQRLLGSINKQRTIYTPEFFVNTKEVRRSGTIPSQVATINNIDSAWDLVLTSSISADNDDIISVNFSGETKTTPNETELYLALYENNIVREIKRGENRNKTLSHDFVVRDWIGPIHFKKTGQIEYSHSITIPSDSKAENTGIAAILVEKKTGSTLQAVKSNLKKLFIGNKLNTHNIIE